MSEINRHGILVRFYDEVEDAMCPDGWGSNGKPVHFDEFVASNESLSVHGERMSKGDYWIGLYGEDGSGLMVNLHATKKGVLTINAEWDER